jgi:hypothetical protein
MAAAAFARTVVTSWNARDNNGATLLATETLASLPDWTTSADPPFQTCRTWAGRLPNSTASGQHLATRERSFRS